MIFDKKKAFTPLSKDEKTALEHYKKLSQANAQAIKEQMAELLADKRFALLREKIEQQKNILTLVFLRTNLDGPINEVREIQIGLRVYDDILGTIAPGTESA